MKKKVPITFNKFNIEVKWPMVKKNGKTTEYNDFEKRCYDEFWSKQDKKVIESCLQKDPEQRATVKEIMVMITVTLK